MTSLKLRLRALEAWAKYNPLVARPYHRFKTRRHFARSRGELRLLPALVPPGRRALDIGANKGIYTEVLSWLAPQVVAFEPNPWMTRILRRVAAGNVRVEAVALSDRPGRAELRVPQRRSGTLSHVSGSLVRHREVADSLGLEVELRSLDSYGFDDVGFIKIDVEGFEAAVLEGAQETLRRCRPHLLVEINESHTGRPVQESLAEITAAGYAGLFLHAGVLHPLAVFDPDRHHRPGTADFVDDFIFLPLETAA